MVFPDSCRPGPQLSPPASVEVRWMVAHDFTDLEAAGEHQRKINDLIAVQQQKLDALAEQRKNKGRGRPSTAHAAQKKAAESRIARLQRGLLPGEPEPTRTTPRTAAELRTSAADHPQHHAAAGTAPAGRPPGSGGSGSDGDQDDRGTDEDDADDRQDPDFHQYYKVSPAQREFNSKVTGEYMSGERSHKQIKIEPDDLLASGCRPELIGVGAVHICAPHLHLGLPLPPCPRHGWASVDGKRVRPKGCFSPARRVYASTADEWLAGVRIYCEMCEEEKTEAQRVVAELEEEGHDDEELSEARRDVNNACCSYMSYNPESLALYAQRYYWYVAALPYVVLNKCTAVTRPLARRIMRACQAGGNPTDLAEELLELKSEWFDLLRAQARSRPRRSPTQPCRAAST